jgi:hypothetical protein
MTPHKFVKRHFVNEVVRQPLGRNWNGVKNSLRAPQKALKNADKLKGICRYLSELRKQKAQKKGAKS